MSDNRKQDDEELSLTLMRQLNELCDEFEKRLAANASVGFTDLVNQIDAKARSQLIRELVALATERLQQQCAGDPAQAIIAQNPGFDEEIEAAIVRQSDVNPTASRDPSDGQAMTELMTPRGRKSRGLRIRCPHCSNHIELVGDTPLDSVNCDVCGSTFSLIDRSVETRQAQALQRIDRFELISRVGVGGFGTVWKARDVELDRTVAVKIPRQGQLSPVEMEQFLREARSVAQLRHPNIVPVHEVGREGDAIYIVSDLVRGASLADVLTSERFTPREAARLCATVANALDHAHCRGIIHRDLKPSNIMIDDNGTPYLMDFGLAKREAEEVTMTVDGQIIGTPAYMSPEQAGGHSAWADRRTDVYSLGVILFELLTGEWPFRGNAQMQVFQRLKDDPPSPRKLNRFVPRDLETIVLKCLERDPNRRYPSAQAVADEFDRFLAGLPIEARPLSALARLARWAWRQPALAAMSALVLFLAVAGPLTAWRIDSQRRRLAELVEEKDHLIARGGQDRARDAAEITRLSQQLAVWEGKAHSWDLWPPQAVSAPRRQLLRALDRARFAQTADRLSAGDLEPWPAACGRMALALLAERAGRPQDAEAQLAAAQPLLRDMNVRNPERVAYAAALARCELNLARLRADRPDAARQHLADAADLLARLETSDDDALPYQIQRFEAEMRRATEAGFEHAPSHLHAATTINAAMAARWPTDPVELYRLATFLANDDPAIEE